MRKTYKLLFVHDVYFSMNENDILFHGPGFDDKYFDRFFLAGFQSVDIFSRSEYNDSLSLSRSSKKNVKLASFVKRGGYRSTLDLINIFKHRNSFAVYDLIVISFPSVNGLFISLFCILFGYRYSLEIAGNTDAFRTKRFGVIFSKIIDFTKRPIVQNSVGVAYVHKHLISQHGFKEPFIIASNVNILDYHSIGPSYDSDMLNHTIHLLFVGGLTKRKGVDVMIQTVNQLKGIKNLSFHLHLVGDSADFDVELMISRYGLSSSITLHGYLTRSGLGELFKICHIYLQPSLSEGLPRATIEAMSYSKPVIATKIDAFKTLLPDDALVQPGSYLHLSEKILEFVQSPCLLDRHSNRNIEFAKRFSYKRLSKIRSDFYSLIRESAKCG